MCLCIYLDGYINCSVFNWSGLGINDAVHIKNPKGLCHNKILKCDARVIFKCKSINNHIMVLVAQIIL